MRASEDLQYMHQQTLLSNVIAAVPKLLTAPCQKGKVMSHRKEVTTGKRRKLEWSQRWSLPLFVSILVFRSILGKNSMVCLLFTVLVLKT